MENNCFAMLYCYCCMTSWIRCRCIHIPFLWASRPPQRPSENDFKSKNSGVSWISAQKKKKKEKKYGCWFKILRTQKNLKLSVDQAVYRQVRLADRACLFGTNRIVAQIKMTSHFQFFWEFFLRIDIFWQLSAFSEVKGI